jgi:imidazolonepropionase-like amidohydrolase
VLWIAGAKLADPSPREGVLRIEGAKITGKAVAAPRGAKVVDAGGLILVPAFVDAHVHLAVAGDPAVVSREEARGGVAAVLDLGAPERVLPLAHSPLRIRWSGPLLTAPGGYPTRSWGANGEGLELSSAGEARASVRRLAAAKARFVKLAFDPRFPMLDPQVARAAADEAHGLGLLVAAHALEEDPVRRALDAGADVLAHTPRDPLPEDLLHRVQGKWVISTLNAFDVPPARLRELREAGARVAYGTDLGNEGTAPGIDARELELIEAAGVDPIAAATSASAALLSYPDLGSLAVGCAASLLAVRSLTPEDLARPEWVMIDGKKVV